MATRTSILAWEILWTEEPGGRQFMGSQRAGHDRAHVRAQESNILDDYWTENMCVFFSRILRMHLQSSLNVCVTVCFLEVSVLLCLCPLGVMDHLILVSGTCLMESENILQSSGTEGS